MTTQVTLLFIWFGALTLHCFLAMRITMHLRKRQQKINEQQTVLNGLIYKRIEKLKAEINALKEQK